MRTFIILIAAVLSGCAALPHTLRAGVEHLSHPAVGRPFDDSSASEDWLDQLAVSANWSGRGWYLESGLGYNLRGRNGSGLYGPALTGFVRTGVEVTIRPRAGF